MWKLLAILFSWDITPRLQSFRYVYRRHPFDGPQYFLSKLPIKPRPTYSPSRNIPQCSATVRPSFGNSGRSHSTHSKASEVEHA